MVGFCPFSRNDESGMLSVVAARWSSIDLHDRRVSGRKWYRDSRMNLTRRILLRRLRACGRRVISAANIEQAYTEKRRAILPPRETRSNKQASAYVAELKGFVARPIGSQQSQLTVDSVPTCLSRHREPRSEPGHPTRFQNGLGTHHVQIAGEGVRSMVSQRASPRKSVNAPAYPAWS